MSSNPSMFAGFNSRGKRQYKRQIDAVDQLSDEFSEYARIGLPAHKAALDGNIEALTQIFSWLEDQVPALDVNGATPLHLAAKQNRVNVIKWLIDYTDLSPLKQAKQGETPVHVAVAMGNVESLRAMMSCKDRRSQLKSSLCTSQDQSGYTPMMLAIKKFHNNCVSMLMDEFGQKAVNSINESGITAAHMAAATGNVEALQIIKKRFKKLLTQKAADGTTPIYFAAQEGRLEAFRFLHQSKCNLQAASNDGLKPIHAASQSGHTNIIKFIVSVLGDKAMMDRTPDGATPLHFAATAGMIKTAGWLLSSDNTGKLIKATDDSQDTPAHDAAEHGQTDMLKFLVEQGADIYAVNEEGNTPYSLALGDKNPEIATFVMSLAAQAPKPQEEAPKQMTIFDLQGKADVVKMDGKEDARDREEEAARDREEEATHGARDKTSPSTEPKAKKDGKGGQHESGSEGTSEIVVCYSDDMEQLDAAQPTMDTPAMLKTSSEYATVNEMAVTEVKRKKKKARSISKSIQNALKPLARRRSQAQRNTKEEQKSKSDNLGFKPRFQSNPLQHMRPEQLESAPTATTSSEPGDDTPVSLDYLGMETPYAQLDPDVVARKRQRREEKAKGAKKDDEDEEPTKITMVDDDSDDEAPPIPPQNFKKVASGPGKSPFNASNSSQSTAGNRTPVKWPPKKASERESPKIQVNRLKPAQKPLPKEKAADEGGDNELFAVFRRRQQMN